MLKDTLLLWEEEKEEAVDQWPPLWIELHSWRLIKQTAQEGFKKTTRSWLIQIENHLLASPHNLCQIQCLYGMETWEVQKEQSTRKVFGISRWTSHLISRPEHQPSHYSRECHIPMYMDKQFVWTCCKAIQRSILVGHPHTLLSQSWSICNLTFSLMMMM